MHLQMVLKDNSLALQATSPKLVQATGRHVCVCFPMGQSGGQHPTLLLVNIARGDDQPKAKPNIKKIEETFESVST